MLPLALALLGCASPSRAVRDAVRRGDVPAALRAYERFVEDRGDGDASLLADIALATLRRMALSDAPGDRASGFAGLRAVGVLAVDTLEPMARVEGVVGDRAALTLWEVQGREGPAPARLREALRAADRERRLLGVAALRPARARRTLLRLLDDADDDVRAAAAQRLATVRHPAVTDALRAHLRDDPDDDVRAACVRGLAGRDEVTDALRAALDDRSAFVRMAVPSALSSGPREVQREALSSLLEGAPTALGVEAARALAARGEAPAAAYLLAVMRGDRPALRAQAAVAASGMVAAHGPALAALLEGDDDEVTLRVASALARVDAYRDAAVRALRRLSNSPDGFVAVRALQARAGRGDAGLAEPLRDALTAPDAGVRRIAVLAWSELAGNTGDLDTLAAMLRDEDRSVVALAASQIILAAAR